MERAGGNRQIMKPKNRQRGISLLEVIIVFAITAVLVALSMPNFHDYSTRARVVDALDQARPAQSALVRTCMSDNQAVVKNNADAGYVHHRSSPDRDFIDRVVLAADCEEKKLVVMVWTYNTGAQYDPVIEWTAEVPTGVTTEGFEPPYGWHCRVIRGDYAHVPQECRKHYRKS